MKKYILVFLAMIFLSHAVQAAIINNPTLPELKRPQATGGGGDTTIVECGATYFFANTFSGTNARGTAQAIVAGTDGRGIYATYNGTIKSMTTSGFVNGQTIAGMNNMTHQLRVNGNNMSLSNRLLDFNASHNLELRAINISEDGIPIHQGDNITIWIEFSGNGGPRISAYIALEVAYNNTNCEISSGGSSGGDGTGGWYNDSVQTNTTLRVQALSNLSVIQPHGRLQVGSWLSHVGGVLFSFDENRFEFINTATGALYAFIAYADEIGVQGWIFNNTKEHSDIRFYTGGIGKLFHNDNEVCTDIGNCPPSGNATLENLNITGKLSGYVSKSTFSTNLQASGCLFFEASIQCDSAVDGGSIMGLQPTSKGSLKSLSLVGRGTTCAGSCSTNATFFVAIDGQNTTFSVTVSNFNATVGYNLLKAMNFTERYTYNFSKGSNITMRGEWTGAATRTAGVIYLEYYLDE